MLKFFAFLTLLGAALCAPAEDLVVDLPGLPGPITSTHYSGYLSATEGRYFHYWFVESQNDPTTDPLVLWLNGGPGCSSLSGFLTELGPYSTDGVNLIENDYSWNKVANVIFLESPACVGFSYDINGSCANSDDETSLGNYLALQDFFTKFPEYDGREFFITGESYAGIYIPTLSIRIVDGMADFPINFQGFAIGNGITSWESNTNSLMFFGRYHKLLDDTMWERMITYCCGGIQGEDTCKFITSIDPICEAEVLAAELILYYGGLNMYNLYGECESTGERETASRYSMDMMNLRTKGIGEIEPYRDPTCTNATPERTYLNNPDVRTALNIPSFVEDWDICWSTVTSLLYTRNYLQMKTQLAYLNDYVRGMIYTGDVDMAVNFLGSEWDIRNLSLPVVAEPRTWFLDGQIGGFVKRLNNLDFVTIRAAGHMVPSDKPAEALYIFESFLANTEL